MQHFEIAGVRTARQYTGVAADGRTTGRRFIDLGREYVRDMLHWQGYALMPEVVDWPYAVDDAGVSYPAGTVGIRFGPNSNLIMAVPDTLPVGYTLNNDMGLQHGGTAKDGIMRFISRSLFWQFGVTVPWKIGQAFWACTGAGQANADATATIPYYTTGAGGGNGIYVWPYVMDGNSLVSPNWGPLNVNQTTVGRHGHYSGGVIDDPVSGAYRERKWLHLHTGYRDVTLVISQNLAAGGILAMDTVDLNITRELSWAKGASDTVPGGTAVATIAMTSGDFTETSPGSGVWEATLRSGAIALPPDGTLASYHVEINAKTTATCVFTWQWDASPRVDIPMPWTCVGDDNRIAPGGWIPAIATNPPAHTVPFVLSSTPTAATLAANGYSGSWPFALPDTLIATCTIATGGTFLLNSGFTSANFYADEFGLVLVASASFGPFTLPAGSFYVTIAASGGSHHIAPWP